MRGSRQRRAGNEGGGQDRSDITFAGCDWRCLRKNVCASGYSYGGVLALVMAQPWLPGGSLVPSPGSPADDNRADDHRMLTLQRRQTAGPWPSNAFLTARTPIKPHFLLLFSSGDQDSAQLLGKP